MRDNPTHVALYGTDPGRRVVGQTRLMKRALAVLGWPILGAYDDSGVLLGVAGMGAPGTCRPTAAQQAKMLPLAVTLGPAVFSRVGQLLGTWGEHDSPVPHVHVGPVAVERHLQGRGIGSRLMAELVTRVDGLGVAAFLETDKPENVRFYQRFGFEVVDEAEPLGVRTWFMLRAAAR
jgi:ribosomal protein S18 acetylase RimI-like enzyme